MLFKRAEIDYLRYLFRQMTVLRLKDEGFVAVLYHYCVHLMAYKLFSRFSGIIINIPLLPLLSLTY